MGTSPKVRRSGPSVETLDLDHRVVGHHLGREIGDQAAEPIHVHHLSHHGFALVVRLPVAQAVGNA